MVKVKRVVKMEVARKDLVTRGEQGRDEWMLHGAPDFSYHRSPPVCHRLEVVVGSGGGGGEGGEGEEEEWEW